MNQLISVLICLVLIPILTKKKMNLGYVLLIATGLMGIMSNIGFKALTQIILSIFTDSSSRTTILTVMMVNILGGLMKHYNILDMIVQYMLFLIHDKKKVLMIIPAIIGLFSIPGGALLSAPFVNNLGKEIELSPPRRAAVNLIFRHLAMFILPYSTVLLVVSAAIPSLNIFRLISINFFYVIAIIVAGYFFFLRDIKLNVASTRDKNFSNLLNLAIYTSPIYVPVIINGVTGISFHITLILSIFIVYLLGNKESFFQIMFKFLTGILY